MGDAADADGVALLSKSLDRFDLAGALPPLPLGEGLDCQGLRALRARESAMGVVEGALLWLRERGARKEEDAGPELP